MSASLCRLFGCFSEPRQPKDNPEEASEVGLQKHAIDIRISHHRETTHENKKTSIHMPVEFPLLDMSKELSNSASYHDELSAITKDFSLRLQFFWKGKLLFVHEINVNIVYKNGAITVKLSANSLPPPCMDRFSMLADYFDIKNESEGRTISQELASNKDGEPFSWNSSEQLLSFTPKGYQWTSSALNRFVFRRVEKSVLITEHTVIACYGNVIVASGSSIGLGVVFIGPKGLEKKYWKIEEKASVKGGRMVDCEIQILGSKCSRYQFEISRTGGKWVLTEGYQGSKPSSHTWILIENKEELLSAGDQFVVGGLKILVTGGAQAQTSFSH